MDNFDLRKYLTKNPLNEAYIPGAGWIKDFSYDRYVSCSLKITC